MNFNEDLYHDFNKTYNDKFQIKTRIKMFKINGKSKMPQTVVLFEFKKNEYIPVKSSLKS